MSRFFVPKEFIKADSIYITGLEAHHILNVMRLKVLDEVVVFDGSGREYAGIVKRADRKSLEVRIKSTREPSAGTGPIITLIQAITKKDKMDYIAQKATELGVFRIIPVTTERTIPEWNDAKRTGIVERWRKIVREAAKQCGRPDIPEIMPIADFKMALVPTCEVGGPTSQVGELKLIAALSDKAIKLKDALKNSSGNKVVIAIGPEGDFTPDEIKMAGERGFKIVTLGRRVLKSDTAALAVLSMISYEYAS